MDRHPATRRLQHLAEAAGIRVTRARPHMLRHTFVTTSFDAGIDLRDVQIAARHADPRTTMRHDRPARTWTATRTTSSPPTWPPALDAACVSRTQAPADALHCRCVRALRRLMIGVCAMTFAVLARLICDTLLARMSAGQ
jgi:hypothetical protein